MKIKTMKELQGMLAEFVENGCCIETPDEIVTLYDWLNGGHDYIPIGKIKIKHGFDEKRHEELDAYGDLFRSFDANYDEPFNMWLVRCLQKAAGNKKIDEIPIMTGFTPFESDEMEIRLEI